MDGLSDQERISVQQLRDLSAGGDDEVFIEVLKSVGWDVQVCYYASCYSSYEN